jgi:hypothetical protein
MIIFGTKPRTKTTGHGEFHCPHCETPREYERKEVKSYFALYFVPIFPIGSGREFIECQTCHHAFETSVLHDKPKVKPRSLAEMLNGAQDILESGMPVEYYVRDLTLAGLDRDVALKTVRDHIGTERKMCPSCGLTYAPSVDTCTECGESLEPHGH